MHQANENGVAGYRAVFTFVLMLAASLFLRTLKNVLINKVSSGVVLGATGVTDKFPAAFAVAIKHGFAFGIIRRARAVFPSACRSGATSQRRDQKTNEQELLRASFHNKMAFE